MNPRRLLYRLRQFWHALRASPTSEDLALAQAVLSPPLMELFTHMQPGEQAHSVRIFRQLCERGELNQDLLVAALLHDAGKSRHPLQLWERVIIVLCRLLVPGLTKQWGKGQPRGWKRAFVIAEQHPTWGAEMAAQAGASPISVSLIRRHQQTPTDLTYSSSLEDRLLIQLQSFDNEN